MESSDLKLSKKNEILTLGLMPELQSLDYLGTFSDK